MKKTELEKLAGRKLAADMAQRAIPERFARGSAALPDRREQRRLERAQGLVPFAVKLDRDLVARLRALAEERRVGLNELVGELLQKGLAAPR